MPLKKIVDLQIEIAEVRKDLAVMQERQDYIIDLLKGNNGILARMDIVYTEMTLEKGNRIGKKELWSMIGTGTIVNIIIMLWSHFGR